MASVARFDGRTPPRREGSARATGPDGLAAFRVLAERDPDRSLTRLIEGEIIPRLLAAHAADAVRPSRPAPCAATYRIDVARIDAAVDAADVESLVPLALQVEADALLAHVEGVLARGVSVDSVLVDLLAPAARLLGEYWEADRCDFVDVTMALWRLQEVVHEIAGRFPVDRPRGTGGNSALFASMPGDSHDFGTVVIDELFRRHGWATERLSGAETTDLLRLAGDGWFDMIGLTVSCDCHIGQLPSIIVALRNVSRNPRVGIMVGGRIFSADPELAAKVGADGTARDAELALEIASDLVRAREPEASVRR